MDINTKKTWLTDALKNSIKTKNKLFARYKKSQDENIELQYKKYRNLLHVLLRKSEKDYYDTLLRNNINNIKNSWRIIKDIINKKKSETVCSRFYVNNDVTTDKKIIADNFNSFFVNVGSNLAKNIPSDPRSPTTFIKERNGFSIYLRSVLQDEVQSIIKI